MNCLGLLLVSSVVVFSSAARPRTTQSFLTKTRDDGRVEVVGGLLTGSRTHKLSYSLLRGSHVISIDDIEQVEQVVCSGDVLALFLMTPTPNVFVKGSVIVGSYEWGCFGEPISHKIEDVLEITSSSAWSTIIRLRVSKSSFKDVYESGHLSLHAQGVPAQTKPSFFDWLRSVIQFFEGGKTDTHVVDYSFDTSSKIDCKKGFWGSTCSLENQIKGHFDVEILLEMHNFEISKLQLKSTANGQATTILHADSGSHLHRTVPKSTTSTFVFWVGGVPMLINQVTQAHFEIELNTSTTIDFKAELPLTLTAELDYDGAWHASSSHSFEPTLTAQVHAAAVGHADIVASHRITIDGMFGFNFTLTPSALVSAELNPSSCSPPALSVAASAAAQSGVLAFLDVLGEHRHKEIDLFDWHSPRQELNCITPLFANLLKRTNSSEVRPSSTLPWVAVIGAALAVGLLGALWGVRRKQEQRLTELQEPLVSLVARM